MKKVTVKIKDGPSRNINTRKKSGQQSEPQRKPTKTTGKDKQNNISHTNKNTKSQSKKTSEMSTESSHKKVKRTPKTKPHSTINVDQFPLQIITRSQLPQITTRKRLQIKNEHTVHIKQKHLHLIDQRCKLKEGTKGNIKKKVKFHTSSKSSQKNKPRHRTSQNKYPTNRNFKRTCSTITIETEAKKRRISLKNNYAEEQSVTKAIDRPTLDNEIPHQRQLDDSIIYNLQIQISELGSKIKNLEEKSFLNGLKMELFKNVIKQRDNYIQTLLAEKEKELLLQLYLWFSNIDPQRICRLCLLVVDNKDYLISLELPENEALVLLIKNATDRQIRKYDGLPSGICINCVQKLRDVEWLKLRVQQSDDLIRNYTSMKKENKVGSGSTASDLYPNSKQLCAEIIEEGTEAQGVKIENVFSLNSLTTTDVKDFKEKAVFDDGLDSCSISLPDEKNQFPFKLHKNDLKNCKLCKLPFLNQWSLKNHYKYCKNAFKCSECKKCFWNVKLYVLHKKKRQSCASINKFRCCQECQIVFQWKWQLVFHILQHKVHECALCNEVVYSYERLKHHVTSSHFQPWLSL